VRVKQLIVGVHKSIIEIKIFLGTKNAVAGGTSVALELAAAEHALIREEFVSRTLVAVLTDDAGDVAIRQ